mmetsp:Transcript_9757/g.14358  ORF Transcript_9757/g.14358 Transcript_9757/m.14358 type:complete len:84 (-) Transcript_9757:25-276(-)
MSPEKVQASMLSFTAVKLSSPEPLSVTAVDMMDQRGRRRELRPETKSDFTGDVRQDINDHTHMRNSWNKRTQMYIQQSPSESP